MGCHRSLPRSLGPRNVCKIFGNLELAYAGNVAWFRDDDAMGEIRYVPFVFIGGAGNFDANMLLGQVQAIIPEFVPRIVWRHEDIWNLMFVLLNKPATGGVANPQFSRPPCGGHH